MSCDPDALSKRTTHEEELGKRIRTLTSLLNALKLQNSPSRYPHASADSDFECFGQLTTLLTSGDKEDPPVNRVIAVTGSTENTTLLVAQNSRGYTKEAKTSLQSITKNENPPKGDVVENFKPVSLDQHIADVWAALSTKRFDSRAPDYLSQIRPLERFILSRCFRKFDYRFKETKMFGKKKEKLASIISKWDPNTCSAVIPCKWVTAPGWLRGHFSDRLQERFKRSKGVVEEWEFSKETIHVWCSIVVAILDNLDERIQRVKSSRAELSKLGLNASQKQKAENELRDEMHDLNEWCRGLYFFVEWKAGVVESLMTETNMFADIETEFMPMTEVTPVNETTGDDDADLRREPDERVGTQVFRYLKTVVAWHAAVHKLAKRETLQTFLNNVEIGLIKVSPSNSSIMDLQRLTEAFFARFENRSNIADRRTEVSKLLEKHFPEAFYGCMHAEAILMGLVNQYGQESTSVQPDAPVDDIQSMIKAVVSARNVPVAIAVSRKCCWCCHWLGQNLRPQFELKLPGTHGILYAWDPPVGLDVPVLQKLEDRLWEELCQTVLDETKPLYSRLSSTASGGISGDEMPDFVLPVLK